jgi:protein-disulfide isomerase
MTAHTSGVRVRGSIAALALCVLGLADAAYLTWDHYAHLASADYGGGLCGVGGGCDLARTSPLSELPLPGGLPGVPIALGGLAFYAGFLFLTRALSRAMAREEVSQARALVTWMALLSGLAVGYSAFLGVMSLLAGGLCPFCTGLYGVNLGLFALSVLPLRRAAGGFGGLLIGLRPARAAALAFALALGAGYALYAAALAGRPDPSAAAPIFAGGPRALPTEGRPATGPLGAKLHVVEFADFECPHCSGAFTKLATLARTFPDALRVTFLHFPLDAACNPLVTAPFHIRACHLARLAECGHRQGRFLEVAGHLYAHARDKDDATLKAEVVALGLDASALEACLADPGSLAAVKADIEVGLKAEVRGTPTVFANGRELGRPLTEALVRELLAGPHQP